MKTGITAKLKLHTTREQFAALRATQLAYRDSLNYVSHYAFEHGKMSNRVALQDGTYDEIRARFRLPSQMACSVPRQVGATYKTLWTKVKQNAAHRQAGRTKKRYKGLVHGSMAIKVDAHYTSKACPVCGHTCDANRPHKGLLFVCQHCHYTLHADLVGARNLAMRTLLVRQDWASTGVLSERPDVSSVEAKAARLSRYAELRWSLDTSPRASAEGI
jgi:ribosomal protein L37AE/L43A